MHLLTIIWTLVCAVVIIGYPLYLLNKSASVLKNHQENLTTKAPNTVELLSFDISEQLPGWSFSLDVPQITEQILRENPVLFYLESKDACLKLPLNNAAMGYKASVYKNVGKVYVTFKSLKDGVSHFYVPNWHLSKLKVLIIKSKEERLYGKQKVSPSKSVIDNNLTKAGVNINDYEDVLGYLSNIASIDFKGHYIAKMPKRKKSSAVYAKSQKSIKEEKLYATA